MSKNKILVVGGSGFIGSHMVKFLTQKSYHVYNLDNLSAGRKIIPPYGEFIHGNVNDSKLLEQIFKNNKFLSVMNFASASIVSESITDPIKYYNNISSSLNLLECMIKYNCLNYIFSSTAAIFGNPVYLPIDEKHPKNPINPYGKSKLMIECILQNLATTFGLNAASLRYFNAAGSDPECEIGETHLPETHLIPLIMQKSLSPSPSNVLEIYGNDYETHDGTCIRDYIHVNDLCNAHYLTMKLILDKQLNGFIDFNLGTSNGISVLEIIEMTKKIIARDQKDFKTLIRPRREGDPSILIADSKKIRNLCGWKPVLSNVENIIEHTWNWQKKLHGI